MLHPSYQELIDHINKVNEEKNLPPINSRYSLVIAASKRARALIDGQKAQVKADPTSRQLSTAVAEMEAEKIGVYTREIQQEDIPSEAYESMNVVDFSDQLEEEE
jgi:DNA-directed RNA polymerase subunit omega